MKKVLFISSKGLDEDVIAAIRLRRMIRYLARHDWNVFCIGPRIRSNPLDTEKNVHLVSLLFIFSGDRWWAKISRKCLFPIAGAVMGGYLCLRHRISLIIPSIPEIEALMAGTGAKLLLGKRVRLIAEIRDPFSLNAAHPWSPRKRRVYRSLESFLMRWPDQVIFLTPTIREMYLSHFGNGQGWSRSNQVITNGYDAAEFEFPADSPGPEIKLAYIGTFYGDRHPLDFLAALKESLGNGRKSVKVIFAGETFGPELNKRIQEQLADPLLAPHIEWRGPCTHSEALRLMKAADVTILITHTHGSEYALPGKLFEYIGAGKPILALTNDPLVIQMINDNHLGWICRDKEELQNWFQSHLGDVQAVRAFSINPEIRKRFSLDEKMREFEKAL